MHCVQQHLLLHRLLGFCFEALPGLQLKIKDAGAATQSSQSIRTRERIASVHHCFPNTLRYDQYIPYPLEDANVIPYPFLLVLRNTLGNPSNVPDFLATTQQLNL